MTAVGRRNRRGNPRSITLHFPAGGIGNRHIGRKGERLATRELLLPGPRVAQAAATVSMLALEA
jgi:hypothetical protein